MSNFSTNCSGLKHTLQIVMVRVKERRSAQAVPPMATRW